MKNYRGFTLAEVLITLGIIGIVAAMTLPGIITRQQEKATVAKLKKAYSFLSQVHMQVVQENGTPDLWDLRAFNDGAGATNISNLYAKYLKISKNCGIKAGCAYDGYYRDAKGINGYNYNTNGTVSKIRLTDGSTLIFHVLDPECRTNLYGPFEACAGLYIDVNGNTKPNQFGVDLFRFYIAKNRIVPAGTRDSITTYTFKNSCVGTRDQPGSGCAAWVIFNENMDYLHCPDKLDWNVAHSCKK